ncbi:MAG: tetratricopeptide repeat protein, partial [Candidatus Rokuibacteriota bacterium]
MLPVDDTATANAIRRHEERLAREPHSLAFAQLADLYRKVGRTGEAIALCRDGLGRYPQYVTARLILAKALVGEGRLEHALPELDAILDASPHDVPSQRLAAELRRRSGDLDGAVRHLEAVVRLDPLDR